MTKSIGRWAAMLVLAAAVMPLGAGAQEKQEKKEAPAKAAPAKPAAPAARPAPAARSAPVARPAPAAHAAPQRQAPQRTAAPQRQAPQRAAAPQRAPQRAAAPAARTATPSAASAAPVTSKAQTRTQQRQERTLRAQENRQLRATSAAQRAAKRQEINQQRQLRVQQRLNPNAQAQPNAAVRTNAQARSGMRRNGQARVTQSAARQGRFASSFASARTANATLGGARVRSGRFVAHQAWRQGLRAAFTPWYGPVFWPYAYSDIFDYAFWPGGYDDGYFAYAYDDFFDGVFFGEQGPPAEYAYDEPGLASAPASAPAPAAPSSYAAVQTLCKQPGSGVTAWPIAEITNKVGLNDEQKQLLDDVKTAGTKAAAMFRDSCPAENAFPLTPPGRLASMTGRLNATLEAVQTVRPALEKFYAALNDEQKERFNEIGPKQPKDNAQASQTSTLGAVTQDSNSCKDQKPGLTNLPIESIEDAVKPNDAQEADLNKLEEATGEAVSILQAACPDETPITPPGRLKAMETRLKAMIDAANTVKPALDSFYASLNSEQKARFNRIGSQLSQTTGQSNN